MATRRYLLAGALGFITAILNRFALIDPERRARAWLSQRGAVVSLCESPEGTIYTAFLRSKGARSQFVYSHDGYAGLVRFIRKNNLIT